MPLIPGCTYQIPAGVALPAPPVAGLALNLALAQEDHLFGKVLGTIEPALQTIFVKGGQQAHPNVKL